MSELWIISSELTDTRHLQRALDAAGRRYRIERLGMGDAASRARFEALCEQAGVRRLPLIRDGERWLGELELMAELASPAALSTSTRVLTWAGLLPMLGGALGVVFGVPGIVPWWLGWAWLLLAFVAGSQWGAALGGPGVSWSFALRSIAAPLVAWPLLQADAVLQAYGLALLYGALLSLDRRLETAGRYPAGYYELRLKFAALSMVSLVLGALAMDW